MAEEPTWEEVVNRVTVASNYFLVKNAADHWTVTFQRIEQLADRVRELSRQSGQSWTGPGAQAFEDHLEKIAKSLDLVTQHHRAVVPALRSCAQHLEAAVHAISIPPWMEADVRANQRAYTDAGVMDDIAPNAFRSWLYQNFPQSERYVEEYVLTYGDQARQAYQRLREQYASGLAAIPEGTAVAAPTVQPDRPGAGSTTRPGPRIPGVGGNPATSSGLPTGLSGVPAAAMPSTGLPTTLPTAPAPVMPTFPSGDTGMPIDSTMDASPITGGLAGLGDLGSQLSNASGGLGGLGSLGGGSTSGGGISGGGAVPLPALRTAATPIPPEVMSGAAGSGAGAGNAGGGLPRAGSGAGAMGMMPMGSNAMPAGSGETSTQLREDDLLMFGRGDQDLPSGVLE